MIKQSNVSKIKDKILPTCLQGNYRHSLGEFSNMSRGVFGAERHNPHIFPSNLSFLQLSLPSLRLSSPLPSIVVPSPLVLLSPPLKYSPLPYNIKIKNSEVIILPC